MNRLLTLLVALPFVASAVDIGDVMRFAGDGGLREVTVRKQISSAMYLCSLDGYGKSLNATLTRTGKAITIEIDDWKTGRMWRITETGQERNVSVWPKKTRSRNAFCTQKEPVVNTGRSAKPQLAEKVNVPGGTFDWDADSITNEIDVMAVFDRTARQRLAANQRTQQGFALAQVAKMNLVLANSNLDGHFRITLRGTYSADFDVTKDCGYSRYSRLSYAITLAADGTDSKWAAIRAERDRLGADLVVIFADSQPDVSAVEDIAGTTGVSFGLQYDAKRGRFGFDRTSIESHRESAYAACDVRVVEIDNTFSHEVGHLLGAGHSDLLDPRYFDPGPQLFAYSSAKMYRDAKNGEYYYTVMGYNTIDVSPYSPEYQEIPYYSSPYLHHPITGSALGDELHDNAQTLRETFMLVSQYRARNSQAITADDIESMQNAWLRSRSVQCGVFQSGREPHVQGTLQLKCGKRNKSGIARISAVVVGLDGSKTRFKSQSLEVIDGMTSATWDTGATSLKIDIAGDRVLGTYGPGGTMNVATAEVGGNLAGTSHRITLDGSVLEGSSPFPASSVISQLLPTDGEPIVIKGQKWSFAKATRVKYAKEKESQDYILFIDDSNGRTNRSGMRLTYSVQTGMFKGSFKIYALEDDGKGRNRLKNYTANVTGVVVNHKGFGQAVVKRPSAGPWLIVAE